MELSGCRCVAMVVQGSSCPGPNAELAASAMIRADDLRNSASAERPAHMKQNRTCRVRPILQYAATPNAPYL